MTLTPQVALATSFLAALAQLPRPIQKKAREFTAKFRANPTSAAINYEALHGMRDPKVRTVRIDQTYRAVVVHPDAGNLYLLVWVDHHDEAMAWAQHKVFDVNATTGAIQVLDLAFAEQPVPAPAARDVPGLFAALDDDALARTGLPAVLVPAVRAVTHDQQLEALQPYLPQEAFEALYLIAAGYEVDHAIRESSRPPPASAPIDRTDFTTALERPASARQFRLIGSDAELDEMLDASIERWRVFLHPNQAAIVKACFRGPARVLGGAGTGKTVVAMHRARQLARRYPEGRILFTAFNRNLARNIAGLLDKLCGADERARIEVVNLHSWVMRYASGVWGPMTIVNAQQAKEAWAQALHGRMALGWSAADYQAEWRDVVQFWGVATVDEYLKASRAGCAKALKRAERAVIWAGLAAFRAALDARGVMDWPDLVRKVRRHLAATGATPFRAVVVDEAQDIDAEQWRLLRVLAPDADDSLFITGDAHQRIYGKPVTLSQFGIAIRGRSHRLKLNYRTPEQVLRWATGLLDGVEIDDLDGGTDNNVGYRSLYGGPAPDVRRCASPSAEAACLVERVQALLAGSPAEEIAVVARTKRRAADYAGVLEAAGVACSVLDADGGDEAAGVRVATMHRVKGLDFTHVVMELPAAATDADPREASLRYVAATRCRKTLTVLRAV
ncbi:MAG: AAA family ATPase [Kofleriaceae bacterium]